MRLLRLSEVRKKIGLTRSEIYRLIKNNEFIIRHYMGDNRYGYLESDVHKWMQNVPQRKRSKGCG
jgi:predicted DNA-binding transcriptional regulator AlpA